MYTLLKLDGPSYQAYVAGFLVLICSICVPAVAEDAGQPVTYKVECAEGGAPCRVDKSTYVGWRTYHGVCHVCHAQDAVGSSFAPNLLDRLQGVEKERFVDVVLNGFTGQIGVMPGWKEDPNVLPRIDDLDGPRADSRAGNTE
jgi:mono/diheme cytochrome c family protein